MFLGKNPNSPNIKKIPTQTISCFSSTSTTLRLTAVSMAGGDFCSNKVPNPFSSVQDHIAHFAADIFSKFDSTRRNLLGNASNIFRPLSLSLSLSPPQLQSSPPGPLFASASQNREEWGKQTFDVALGEDYISKTLVGTSVYTVANMNNEFVLISDPNDDNLKSIGLLCFRQEDAQTLLAQVG